MQEIAAVLCGRDLQTLTDLEQALHSPGGGVRLRDEAARIYEFPDGTVYHFAVRPVQDKYGIPYTEVMATDVTQLATLHAALQQENERLADANRRAKRLYDNMPDIVREEEILKILVILVKQDQLAALEMKIHLLLQLVKNIIKY